MKYYFEPIRIVIFVYKNYGVIFHFCTSQVSLSQNPNKMLPVVASTAGAAATEARHGFNAEHAADCPCKIGVRLNLWTAAARGDVDRLRELLGGGAPTEVDKGDDYGHTALHGAAVAGHAAAVAVLLAAGAQVDNAVCGATPLHRAAALGRRDVVTALLAAGASVAVRDSSTGDLRTPLAKAAVGGHTAIVPTCWLQAATWAQWMSAGARHGSWQLCMATWRQRRCWRQLAQTRRH